MTGLKIVLAIKIIYTIFVWSLPLLLFPEFSAALFDFPELRPIVFFHLLGAAFLALCVGYILGYIELHRGKKPRNAVWVGIVSNGSAFLILLVFQGEWSRWSAKASIYMWCSTVVTCLVTAGLVWFGVIKRDSEVT